MESMAAVLSMQQARLEETMVQEGMLRQQLQLLASRHQQAVMQERRQQELLTAGSSNVTLQAPPLAAAPSWPGSAPYEYQQPGGSGVHAAVAAAANAYDATNLMQPSSITMAPPSLSSPSQPSTLGCNGMPEILYPAGQVSHGSDLMQRHNSGDLVPPAPSGTLFPPPQQPSSLRPPSRVHLPHASSPQHFNMPPADHASHSPLARTSFATPFNTSAKLAAAGPPVSLSRLSQVTSTSQAEHLQLQREHQMLMQEAARRQQQRQPPLSSPLACDPAPLHDQRAAELQTVLSREQSSNQNQNSGAAPAVSQAESLLMQQLQQLQQQQQHTQQLLLQQQRQNQLQMLLSTRLQQQREDPKPVACTGLDIALANRQQTVNAGDANSLVAEALARIVTQAQTSRAMQHGQQLPCDQLAQVIQALALSRASHSTNELQVGKQNPTAPLSHLNCTLNRQVLPLVPPAYVMSRHIREHNVKKRNRRATVVSALIPV